MSAQTKHSLDRLLLLNGPLAKEGFEPGPDNYNSLSQCKVLVVGAGGLGCELLKDLAYMGFCNLHVIDMDTIDLSNLNRQFLFRTSDIGHSKSEAAAAAIMKRRPSCSVTPHFCPIQDKDEDFYRGFNIIICGLDSVVARRWLNAMICSLLEYDETTGALDYSTIRPLIDGGTEGLAGNARVVFPGITPCIECTLNLYPPAVNFPLCTIAHTPRLPEHCVEYVRLIQWTKEQPFGDEEIDGDSSEHVSWVCQAAEQRAQEYGITGVTYRLTQGVLKHIIPAVASTNAVIAAACALEALKLATDCAPSMDNYLNFSQTSGVFAGTVQMERREDCPICNNKAQTITLSEDKTLQQLIDLFINEQNFQMKSPTLTAPGITLYNANIHSLELKTRPNLKKTLKELHLMSGTELIVTDVTAPQAIKFKLCVHAPDMLTD